jgi:sec-independent protein translocase protein TatA
MPNIGPLEIIIVLVIVLVIFGPKRLPDLGRSLGRGMREFKDSVTGKDKDELPAADERADAKPEPRSGSVVETSERRGTGPGSATAEPTEQKS